jgi:hypothetical protein
LGNLLFFWMQTRGAEFTNKSKMCITHQNDSYLKTYSFYIYPPQKILFQIKSHKKFNFIKPIIPTPFTKRSHRHLIGVTAVTIFPYYHVYDLLVEYMKRRGKDEQGDS